MVAQARTSDQSPIHEWVQIFVVQPGVTAETESKLLVTACDFDTHCPGYAELHLGQIGFDLPEYELGRPEGNASIAVSLLMRLASFEELIQATGAETPHLEASASQFRGARSRLPAGGKAGGKAANPRHGSKVALILDWWGGFFICSRLTAKKNLLY
ncbi:hypothetical protein HY224_03165 [Candidatus Uhrbacteria bacterium]|nr:hypothetical protein [Candidatus Uhrbacteria bacterium]